MFLLNIDFKYYNPAIVPGLVVPCEWGDKYNICKKYAVLEIEPSPYDKSKGDIRWLAFCNDHFPNYLSIYDFE